MISKEWLFYVSIIYIISHAKCIIDFFAVKYIAWGKSYNHINNYSTKVFLLNN